MNDILFPDCNPLVIQPCSSESGPGLEILAERNVKTGMGKRAVVCQGETVTLIRALAIFVLLGLTSLSGRADTTTAAEDHAAMMALLGVETLRRGADGDPDSPFAANYDENLANENLASLPALLITEAGEPVATPEQWWGVRRQELIELFNREIYGHEPEMTPSVTWKMVGSEESRLGEVDVIVEQLRGEVDNRIYPAITVTIELKLTYPKIHETPMPVIMDLVWSEEFLARFRAQFTEEQLKAFTSDGPSWQELTVARGWAAAEYVPTSVQADSGDGLREGIIGLVNQGRARKPDDWGALRAWAWGASRILDYFDLHEGLDESRVAIGGHSRYGKAALVAMAFDQRFAAGYISSSGEGGAKLWRRHYGEQVGNLAGAGEYHWMAGNFIRYAGPLNVNDLPVDAHELIALCAPRPVYISSGNVGDQWVDPKGMFWAAYHASPAYVLLGAQGIDSAKFPVIETQVGGTLVYRQHGEGHTPGPNWPHFLDLFALYQ